MTLIAWLREEHAVVNPLNCNVCVAFTGHALHSKPAQHGTHKVTARTTSHKADIKSDDASLARKLSMRDMYMEHVSYWHLNFQRYSIAMASVTSCRELCTAQVISGMGIWFANYDIKGVH